ncbi:hypothetical protein F4813DRAFT_356501 [Daldinia decipiens]|uniref:uncharacterized protein n=1 Tax=Daldinia decipiens TaxID=326647 RepID=UPI0020C519C1|nr:uncharacterized protein F4813DRAFT_356501 [Daldinia decipiens]KAI1658337.1 hypothetical protein F4813DRAFT_356501 [Daldinia decipiens]
MTSYTTPQESEPHPPGSFPTDDVIPTQDSSLTSSSSHNKLHKRDDPRGWSEEEKAAWGHQHTDSGVGLTDPTLSSNPHTLDRASDGAFHSNNTTLQNNGVAPSTVASTTTRSPNYQGNEGKPGVMTGAYGHNNVDSGNNYYPKPTTEDTSSQNQTNARGVDAVGSAPGIATATKSGNAEREQIPEDRNTIQNGLRQTSNVEHDDPYWGNIPHGTGVYNTVTGHGSSETATDGSLHSQGLLSHEQQRAFPLQTSNNAAHDETGQRNGSRFKESLGESTTGAAAGLTTYELAERRRDHQHEDDLKEPTSRKHHEADTKKESKFGSLFHRDHKAEKETKSEKLNEPVPSKDDRPLRERDAGVALAAATGAYGAKNQADKHDNKARESEHDVADNKANALYQHPNEKINSKDPFIAAGYTKTGNQGSTKITNNAYPPSEDVTTRGNPYSSQTTEKPNERNDSKLGYGLAAAGVGAGAGYAAHEHANRDSEKNKVHPNQQAFHDSTTASKAITQPLDAGYTIGKPQLAVFPGTGKTTAPYENTQGLSQSGSSASRSLDDSSRHGEYNVLQGGPPSGANVGDHHYGDKKNVIASSSPNATRDAVTNDNHTGAKAAAAGAGAGAAGAGAAAHYTGKRNSNSTSNTSSAPYEVSGANGRAPTDSTHGSTYKASPTHTPSGTNADDGQQYNKHNAATPSPTSATRGTVDDNNHSRAKAATGAAGVIGAVATAKHHSQRNTNDPTAVPSTTTRDHQSSTTSSSNRASSDSSHGGQYNVLPSGTPSGINISERDDLSRKSLDDTASKTKTPATAAHPTATSAIPASKKDVAGTSAGVPAGLNPADKVLHRCRKCGEENDITGYFRA